MKQKDLVEAYIAAKKLNEQTLKSGKIAKKIFELTSGLKRFFDFQVQEENKIFAEHPKYDLELGGIPLGDNPSEEVKKQAEEELNVISNKLKELNGLESEFEFESFTISLDSVNLTISGKDIGTLSPFITFE